MRRNGTMELTNPQRPSRGGCHIEGCDLTDIGPHQLCAKHYARFRRYGDPQYSPGPRVRFGPDNNKWVGDEVGYYGAHQRLYTRRGPAAAHPCADCGGVAAQWSYDRQDPDEKLSLWGPYSTDPAHYVARCTPCHKSFDLAAIRQARR
jgi:hypothetical protein